MRVSCSTPAAGSGCFSGWITRWRVGKNPTARDRRLPEAHRHTSKVLRAGDPRPATCERRTPGKHGRVPYDMGDSVEDSMDVPATTCAQRLARAGSGHLLDGRGAPVAARMRVSDREYSRSHVSR